MYKPKVYTASKIRHAQIWRTASTLYPQIEFTARWISIAKGVPDHLDTTFWNDHDRMIHWIQDVQDVQRSDYLLVFAERDTDDDAQLKGSLIEAGVALGLGKIVLQVGLSPRHSWTAHPLVFGFDVLDEAFAFILSGGMSK